MLDDDTRRWGEAIYEQFRETAVIDEDGWAFEVAQRLADRLQAGDPPDARLVPVVVWLEAPYAFTTPGRYVYLSRELLSLSMPEDARAFIFAHEIAHHRLGHLDRLHRLVPWLPRVGAAAAALLAHVTERLLYSPEQELAADRWALELCLAAGFDGRRCLDFFGAMERYQLDHRDIAGVFGPEDEERMAEAELLAMEDDEPRALIELRRWSMRANRWLWTRRRGYPALRERRAALAAMLG